MSVMCQCHHMLPKNLLLSIRYLIQLNVVNISNNRLSLYYFGDFEKNPSSIGLISKEKTVGENRLKPHDYAINILRQFSQRILNQSI